MTGCLRHTSQLMLMMRVSTAYIPADVYDARVSVARYGSIIGHVQHTPEPMLMMRVS